MHSRPATSRYDSTAQKPHPKAQRRPSTSASAAAYRACRDPPLAPQTVLGGAAALRGAPMRPAALPALMVPGEAVLAPGSPLTPSDEDDGQWVAVGPETVDSWREHAWAHPARGRTAADDSDGSSVGAPRTASADESSACRSMTSMSRYSSDAGGSEASSARSSLDGAERCRAASPQPRVRTTLPTPLPRAPPDPGSPSPVAISTPLLRTRRLSEPEELRRSTDVRSAEEASAAAVQRTLTQALGEASAGADAAAARGAALAQLRVRADATRAGAAAPPRALQRSHVVGAPGGAAYTLPLLHAAAAALRRSSGDSSDGSACSPLSSLPRSFSCSSACPPDCAAPVSPPPVAGALRQLLLAAATPRACSPTAAEASTLALAAADPAAARAAAAAAAAAATATAADAVDADAVELCCRLSRARQTVDFVSRQRARHCALAKARLSLWDALLLLADVPPVAAALAGGPADAPPVRHLAAAVAAADAALLAYPSQPWLAFVALTANLGRLLLLPRFGAEPAWAVVGDTFPVGCRFDASVSYAAAFGANPDRRKRAYASPTGVYSPGAGLAEVDMCWSGDEYLLEVLARNRADLPVEGLFCVRYASFAALCGGSAHGYNSLMSAAERAALPSLLALRALRRDAAVTAAQPGALGGVDALRAREAVLRPLLEHFCPGELRW